MADHEKRFLRKGRGFKFVGEAHPNAKLSDSMVLKMRKLYDTGKFTVRQLAKKFCVSKSLVSLIIRGESWKHVGGAKVV